jgi:hypothetical protein
VAVSVGAGDRANAGSRSLTHDYAMLEELDFVRREAQAEADLAYQDWSCLPGGGRYAVYRAAQDRADAAHDDLAIYVRKLALSAG